MNAVWKPLPACLAAAPNVLVANTTGPDGIRLRIGPKLIDPTILGVGSPPAGLPMPPHVSGSGPNDPNAGAGLPSPLPNQPFVRLTGDVRPRGIRVWIGRKAMDLPVDSYELFAAISTGHPDPDDLNHDYIAHGSATREACRLRAGVGRLRARLKAAFTGEPDAALARNVILTVPLEKAYILHPALTVCVEASVRQLEGRIKLAILELLLEMLPPCEG